MADEELDELGEYAVVELRHSDEVKLYYLNEDGSYNLDTVQDWYLSSGQGLHIYYKVTVFDDHNRQLLTEYSDLGFNVDLRFPVLPSGEFEYRKYLDAVVHDFTRHIERSVKSEKFVANYYKDEDPSRIAELNDDLVAYAVEIFREEARYYMSTIKLPSVWDRFANRYRSSAEVWPRAVDLIVCAARNLMHRDSITAEEALTRLGVPPVRLQEMVGRLGT